MLETNPLQDKRSEITGECLVRALSIIINLPIINMRIENISVGQNHNQIKGILNMNREPEIG